MTAHMHSPRRRVGYRCWKV